MNLSRKSSLPIPGMFFGILRSFSVVARTLNLSHATKELSLTRQSAKRHITDLEDFIGEQLLSMEHGQYMLTPAGQEWVLEIDHLLEQVDLLFGKSSKVVDGLPAINIQISERHWFHAQQHPVINIFNEDVPPLLKRGLEGWTNGRGELENQYMKKIRPYLLVYRRMREHWICTEVGENSTYANWLGPTWAKSAIGQPFDNDPIKSQADNFLLKAHSYVSRIGSPWYGHTSTKFSKEKSGELFPLNYQKLVMPCRFADGSPAVAILTARTDKIKIHGLSEADIPVTPQDELMEYDI